MPVIQFAAAISISLFIPFIVGYPIALMVSRKIGAERILWAFPLGLAGLVVAISTAQRLVPVATATPAISAAIAGVLIWLATGNRRKRLGRDLTLLWRRLGALLPCLVVISIVLIDLPVLRGEAIVFEGPGHDGIFYVANAIWMQTHSFLQPLNFTVAKPAEYLNSMFFGPHAPLGRVGSEGYLAYVSSLAHKSPLYFFHAVETTAFLIIGVTILLLVGIKRISRTSVLFRAYILSIVFLGTLALSIPLNSNFSTLFGIAFSTAFAFSGGEHPSINRIGRSLCWAALLGSYPELVPFALAPRGLAALFPRRGGATSIWTSIKGELVRTSADVVVGSLAFPWLLYSSLFVIHNAYFVATDSKQAAFPNVYAGTHSLALPLAYFTTSTKFANYLPGVIAVLFEIALGGALLWAMFSRAISNVVKSGIALFAVGTIAAIALGFNYGLIKIPQYFSCYVAAALCAPALTTHRFRDSLLKKFSWVILILLTMMQSGASYFTLKGAYWLATQKYIDQPLFDFIHESHNIAGDSMIAISIERNPFYYSMWFGLLLDGPVRYINSTNGGFYVSYLEGKEIPSLSKARFLITDSGSVIDPVYPNLRPLLHLGKYNLYPFRGVVMSAKGLYSPEGGFSWLADEMQIEIDGSGAKYINFHFGNIFDPGSGEKSIKISDGNHSCTTALAYNGAMFSLPLLGISHEDLVVKPSFPARSPSSLGLGGDPRPLTVQVMNVALTMNPRYPLAQCKP